MMRSLNHPIMHAYGGSRKGFEKPPVKDAVLLARFSQQIVGEKCGLKPLGKTGHVAAIKDITAEGKELDFRICYLASLP